MSDKSLVYDFLVEMIESAEKVLKRCKNISSVDDFLTEDGQIILDSICMQLIALGEGVKKVDKLTNKRLLNRYPQVNWRAVSAMRDILSHHYFDLNAETVYGVCTDEIENLRDILIKIKDEYKKSFKE